MLPAKLSHDVCLSIIDEIFEKESSLNKILKERGLNPRMFYEIIYATPKLHKSYLAAQQARSEELVEEIVEIADNETDPHKARVRTDVRRWYASKMQPSKYSDRIDVNVTQTVDIGQALIDAKKRAELPDIVVLPIIQDANDDEDIFS